MGSKNKMKKMRDDDGKHKVVVKKMKKKTLNVSIQTIREHSLHTIGEHPDISPLVGYFSTGFDPLKNGLDPELKGLRNVKWSHPLQLVVSPSGPDINFLGTYYSGEAAATQICTYALGVDKHTQTLKKLPIAANKDLKEALAHIRICSRLEGLLAKKKSLGSGDSREVHTQKTISEQPDKISPLVGYFSTSFYPLKNASDPEVKVLRNVKRSNRLQLVLNPSGSDVNFVATNYSGEAAAPQLCTYALRVLDKHKQTLKNLPIAANKSVQEVHHAIVSSIQDLSKVFSSYKDEVLVKREERLQFAQSATAGLKLNAEIGRIDAEASLLREKLDEIVARRELVGEGHGTDSKGTTVATVEVHSPLSPSKVLSTFLWIAIAANKDLKEALSHIRICSRLEGLLAKKKSIGSGDSREVHTQKTISEQPDKISPLVGYFSTSFYPLKNASDPEVKVLRNVKRSNRLQLVVSPSGSDVNFVATNYSGGAAAPQLCTYARGVLDKHTQALKKLPIAAKKSVQEVHHAIVSSIQDLSKVFSSYKDEVLVKREERLQFAQSATAGLKLNAEIGRIDAEASLLREKLDEIVARRELVGEGHGTDSKGTTVATVEG